MGEKKFIDTGVAVALTAPSNAAGMEVNPGSTTPVNAMVQGNGNQQRVGRQIREQYLQLKGTITVPAQTNQVVADIQPNVCIWVVRDNQSNGLQADSEDCFENPFGSSALACQPLRNKDFGPRFTVLASRKLLLKAPPIVYDGTNIEQAGSHLDFTINIPLKNRKTTYSETTATFLGMQTGAINIFACANDISTAPVLTYICRMTYTDA